jgi:hypothetical protein
MGQGVTIESSAHAPNSAGSNVSIVSIPFACMATTMCKSTDHRSKKRGGLLTGTGRCGSISSAPPSGTTAWLRQAEGKCRRRYTPDVFDKPQAHACFSCFIRFEIRHRDALLVNFHLARERPFAKRATPPER